MTKYIKEVNQEEI